MARIDRALKYAQRVAGNYGVRLGDCLFADDFGGISGDEISLSWTLEFGMVDGPTDWVWLLTFDDIGKEAIFVAMRGRPPESVAPRIRRGRLFFWRLYWP